MSLSWGAVAGSFMAPYFYALYWKRTTLAGVKAGMLTGLTLAVSLFFILGPANSPIASSIHDRTIRGGTTSQCFYQKTK